LTAVALAWLIDQFWTDSETDKPMIGIGTMRAQQDAQKYPLAKKILFMTDAVGFESCTDHDVHQVAPA
jgi:hypothetical protein